MRTAWHVWIVVLLLVSGGFASSSPQPAPARPSPQAGQPLRIMNGPVIEYADQTSAAIAWSTNLPSSSRIEYGVDRNNLNELAEGRWGGTTHRVQLKSLRPNTTYYFSIESGQAQGTGAETEVESERVFSFQTPATAAAAIHEQTARQIWGPPTTLARGAQAVRITAGPRLEHADASSAVIAWSTNVPSSTRLYYGTEPNNPTQLAEAPWGGTTHRVRITNLQPNTTYYFQVESGQAQGTGTEAESQQVMSFHTAPGRAVRDWR